MGASSLYRWLCVLALLTPGGVTFGAFDLHAEVARAIAAGGGEVVVPPGEHVLQQPLLIEDASKLDIVGYDQERCILRLESAGRSLLELRGKCADVHIRKLTFDGAQRVACGIRVGLSDASSADVKGVVISDCFVQGFSEVGLEVLAAQSSRVERCTFMDIRGSAVRLAKGSRDIVLKHSHITRSLVAVALIGAEECGVVFNEMRDCGSGICSEGGRENRFVGNQLFQIGASGILLLHDSTSHEVSDNEMDEVGGTGILLSGSGHRVKANVITGAKAGPLEIREGTHRLEPPHGSDAR